jgi:hypothetical protein
VRPETDGYWRVPQLKQTASIAPIRVPQVWQSRARSASQRMQ